MHSSRACYRSASTAHGMRRILKKLPPVQKYIGQAVRAGIYYKDEVKQQQGSKRPVRRTSPQGTEIDDYPIEYEILTLNPPIPEQPRIPKKFRPPPPQLPTQKLAKKHLKRLQHDAEEEISIDDYYQRLLGIPSQNKSSAMAFKSSQINKAHAFAMKQYEVMRTENMSEEEALDVVQDLLEQDSLQEMRTSRQTRNTIVKEMSDKQEESAEYEAEETMGPKEDTMHDELATSAIPSVLHSKPGTIRGMHAWSQRLEVVPYKEWTVGATTALDHWIARSILELDDSTWLELLEGSNPQLKSRGRDILAVRQALFPETILDRHGDEDMEMMQEEESDVSTSDKSIDELLASLGAFDDDGDATFATKEEADNDSTTDDEISKLVDELQEWRAKNQTLAYIDWSTSDQEKFTAWLEHYVARFTTEAGGEVDLVATRQALLDVPPMTREESDVFWSRHEDEAMADEWLQSVASLNKRGLLEQDSSVLKSFLSLPYKFQIDKLVELGTLEPLLNEYTAESERVEFLKRHSDKLLLDLPIEHLVSDPQGPIVAQDLGKHWMEQHGVDKNERFSIKKEVPEKSKQVLFEAYNTHKAGRAQYEETMFQQGKLGLRYSDDPQNEIDDDE